MNKNLERQLEEALESYLEDHSYEEFLEEFNVTVLESFLCNYNSGLIDPELLKSFMLS